MARSLGINPVVETMDHWTPLSPEDVEGFKRMAAVQEHINKLERGSGRRLGPLHDYHTRRLALWGY